jgi:hypothetical protein
MIWLFLVLFSFLQVVPSVVPSGTTQGYFHLVMKKYVATMQALKKKER